MKNLKKLLLVSAASILLSISSNAQTLDQVLQQVRSEKAAAQAEQQKRINEFRNNRNKQRALMNEIEQQVKEQESLSKRLSTSFDSNENKLTELETQLVNRLGDLGEVVGVVRQIASDGSGIIANSIVTSGNPERTLTLDKLSESTEYPSLEELESMWLTFMEEIAESGSVKRFTTTIRDSEGNDQEQEVVRIGSFNAVSGDKFLGFSATDNKLYELARQPESRFSKTAAAISSASAGDVVPFALDPSGGVILKQLITKSTPKEIVEQGGIVGYIILGLGAIGLLMAIWRLIYLTTVGGKIRSQAKSATNPKANNPLGRILGVHQENPNVDTETLELKLDEAILKETPRLERMQGALKIIAAIAPLLGLLGTVIGMIETFEMITLFGAGDPKQMASGISTALVTTMLGLIVAIPIVLLHSWVSGKSKGLIEILEEQSAGLIAKHAENK